MSVTIDKANAIEMLEFFRAHAKAAHCAIAEGSAITHVRLARIEHESIQHLADRITAANIDERKRAEHDDAAELASFLGARVRAEYMASASLDESAPSRLGRVVGIVPAPEGKREQWTPLAIAWDSGATGLYGIDEVVKVEA